jgi:hypothetical protein
LSICTAPNCTKNANRVKAGLCEAHYVRLRRNGDFEPRNIPSTRKMHSAGYVLVPALGHPLQTGSQTYMYEHRKVFFDSFGEGPFKCHWCQCGIDWNTLHIDHLDDNKTNNVIPNLVASCAVCNQARGRSKSVECSKRNGRVIEFNGMAFCVADWARILGVTVQSMHRRLARWPIARALTAARSHVGPLPQADSRSQRYMRSANAMPIDLAEAQVSATN